MKPKAYRLLLRCIEDGVEYGYRRAHKHIDNPSEDTIKFEIENGIIHAIHEWFDFSQEFVSQEIL